MDRRQNSRFLLRILLSDDKRHATVQLK